MRLNPEERLAIKGEAFRVMTGHCPPFMDPPSASYPEAFDVRREAYNEWAKNNAVIITAMLDAFDTIKGRDDVLENEN